MSREFNISGPCDPEKHYMIPAEERLPTARHLITKGDYFVIHAPRQTGKTTTIRALAKRLTEEGKFAALYFTCEQGTVARDDYAQAEQVICRLIRRAASEELPAELQPPLFPQEVNGLQIRSALTAWSKTCPRPLVLFFDEIDGLQGESLRTVLSQIRAGHGTKPLWFPHSIILCGLRDVRDYKMASGGHPEQRSSPSPFNISVESLRIGDFTLAEVNSLYSQHTSDTGQKFTEEAVLGAFELTQGQPWLVNALAREVIEKMGVTGNIEKAHILEAKERLILARATHLDSLVDKLHEPRVRRVIEPIIGGRITKVDATYSDDLSYVVDLGLVSRMPLQIANPIYREVILRVLASGVQDQVMAEPRSFVMSDGRFNMSKMLEEFADFWRTNGDILVDGMLYHEVAPQLVMMAFLQRVVNGGGYVTREYGVGRGRIDLLVRWKYGNLGAAREQVEAIELKVWIDKQKDPLSEGLNKLEQYLDKLGLTEGVLVIFDRRSIAPEIEERTVFEEAKTPKGYHVTVLRG